MRKLHTVFLVAVPICTTTNGALFPFLHTLTNTYLLSLWWYSNKCEALSHCGFDLNFPDDSWCWLPFLVSFGHFYVFIGKLSIHVLCPFRVELFEFFFFFQFNTNPNFFFLFVVNFVIHWNETAMGLHVFLIYLYINPLSYKCFANILAHSIGFFFSFCWFPLCDVVPLFFFAFVACAFADIFRKLLPRPMSRSFSLHFLLRVFF